jgi:hypothetical protein
MGCKLVQDPSSASCILSEYMDLHGTYVKQCCLPLSSMTYIYIYTYEYLSTALHLYLPTARLRFTPQCTRVLRAP